MRYSESGGDSAYDINVGGHKYDLRKMVGVLHISGSPNMPTNGFISSEITSFTVL